MRTMRHSLLSAEWRHLFVLQSDSVLAPFPPEYYASQRATYLCRVHQDKAAGNGGSQWLTSHERVGGKERRSRVCPVLAREGIGAVE